MTVVNKKTKKHLLFSKNAFFLDIMFQGTSFNLSNQNC